MHSIFNTSGRITPHSFLCLDTIFSYQALWIWDSDNSPKIKIYCYTTSYKMPTLSPWVSCVDHLLHLTWISGDRPNFHDSYRLFSTYNPFRIWRPLRPYPTLETHTALCLPILQSSPLCKVLLSHHTWPGGKQIYVLLLRTNKRIKILKLSRFVSSFLWSQRQTTS